MKSLELGTLLIRTKAITRSFGFALLGFMLMASACMPDETRATSGDSNPPVKSTPTTSEIIIENVPHPGKVLLSLGDLTNNRCFSANRTEIWVSHYPHDVTQPLLQDAGIDYLQPRWSPSGEWIAYVASSPLEVVDPASIPDVAGTDSIWIMEEDGSNHRRVSEDIPSILIRSRLDKSCFEQSSIMIPPTWSPAEKYIIFAQATWDNSVARQIYNYYLSDIGSGFTRLLLSQDVGRLPVWIVDDIAVIGGSGHLNIIKGLGTNGPIDIKIPYPSNIPLESESFVSALNDKDLIVSFRLGSSLISPVPKEVSVWELDPLAGKWTYLTTIQKQTWGIPNVVNSAVILCEENAITVLDRNSWDSLKQITSAELDMDWIDCNQLKTVRQRGGEDLLVFPAISSSGLELITVLLKSQGQRIETLIDSVTYSQLPRGLQLLDFSFRPDS